MQATRRRLLALLCFALLVLVGAPPAHAAGEPRLDLVLDSNQLQVGQTVSAEIRLMDGVARGRPELPVGDGLQVAFTGQSSQHVIVNFEATRITAFSYALTAIQPGTFQVGPVELQVGDRVLRAEARTVTVAPRSKEQAQEQRVATALSDDDPYLGQVVVFSLRHEHRDQALDLDWTPPAFDGFITEKVAEPLQLASRFDQDGQPYGVEEIFLPLVATATGARTVPPAVISARVPARRQESNRRNPFMTSTQTLTLASEPIPVTIRPLPEQGRPADFSGLVGHFSLSSSLRTDKGERPAPGAPVELRLGESLTMELLLEGDGTLAGVQLPAAAQDAGYRAYDDSPEVQAAITEGRFVAKALFRRAIVPEAEGALHIPPVTLQVFDPSVEAYVSLQTEALDLTVLPGEAGQGQVQRFTRPQDGGGDSRAEVEALGEDILPVPGQARIRDRSLRAVLPWALGLPVLPALGLAGLGARTLLARRRPDPQAALRRALAQLPAEPKARVAALEAAFREACALRLGVPAPGLTRAQVAGLGEEAAALYAELERARYGGHAPDPVLEQRVRAFVEGT